MHTYLCLRRLHSRTLHHRAHGVMFSATGRQFHSSPILHLLKAQTCSKAPTVVYALTCELSYLVTIGLQKEDINLHSGLNSQLEELTANRSGFSFSTLCRECWDKP